MATNDDIRRAKEQGWDEGYAAKDSNDRATVRSGRQSNPYRSQNDDYIGPYGVGVPFGSD